MEREKFVTPEYTERLTCRSCDGHMETILDMGMHKLPGFEEQAVDIKAPLELCMCRDCTLLQLRHTTTPGLLWNENYGYKSGINEAIRNDLVDIAQEAIHTTHLKPGDLVVDIGCNDGTLLKCYPQGVFTVGFEPSRNVAMDAANTLYGRGDYKVFVDFFNSDAFVRSFGNQKARAITAISMFYDLNNPNKFLQDAYRVLDKDGLLVVQQNYLAKMLENCAFDNVCHEHLEYYSLSSMMPLLARNGFKVIDVEENDINGGSFRTYIRKVDGNLEREGGAQRVLDMLAHESRMGLYRLDTYQKFARKIEQNGSGLRDYIQKVVDNGGLVFAYGASTRGGTVLQHYGLDNRLIAAAVERNPAKWGKIMSTGNIPIVSEEVAREVQPDFMLILPWFFTDVFVKRENEYLKKGGRFIVPLPQMRVIDYEDINNHSNS